MRSCQTADRTLRKLQSLLAILRAGHWSHWTSHWQVKGNPYYGDHLLMERLYTGMVVEIDTLAEKIVAQYGPDSVDPICQAQAMEGFLELQTNPDPIQRALAVETYLLEELARVFKDLESYGTLSLGLNDFLAATANSHETYLYLLRQRTR